MADSDSTRRSTPRSHSIPSPTAKLNKPASPFPSPSPSPFYTPLLCRANLSPSSPCPSLISRVFSPSKFSCFSSTHISPYTTPLTSPLTSPVHRLSPMAVVKGRAGLWGVVVVLVVVLVEVVRIKVVFNSDCGKFYDHVCGVFG